MSLLGKINLNISEKKYYITLTLFVMLRPNDIVY